MISGEILDHIEQGYHVILAISLADKLTVDVKMNIIAIAECIKKCDSSPIQVVIADALYSKTYQFTEHLEETEARVKTCNDGMNLYNEVYELFIAHGITESAKIIQRWDNSSVGLSLKDIFNNIQYSFDDIAKSSANEYLKLHNDPKDDTYLMFLRSLSVEFIKEELYVVAKWFKKYPKLLIIYSGKCNHAILELVKQSKSINPDGELKLRDKDTMYNHTNSKYFTSNNLLTEDIVISGQSILDCMQFFDIGGKVSNFIFLPMANGCPTYLNYVLKKIVEERCYAVKDLTQQDFTLAPLFYRYSQTARIDFRILERVMKLFSIYLHDYCWEKPWNDCYQNVVRLRKHIFYLHCHLDRFHGDENESNVLKVQSKKLYNIFQLCFMPISELYGVAQPQECMLNYEEKVYLKYLFYQNLSEELKNGIITTFLPLLKKNSAPQLNFELDVVNNPKIKYQLGHCYLECRDTGCGVKWKISYKSITDNNIKTKEDSDFSYELSELLKTVDFKDLKKLKNCDATYITLKSIISQYYGSEISIKMKFLNYRNALSLSTLFSTASNRELVSDSSNRNASFEMVNEIVINLINDVKKYKKCFQNNWPSSTLFSPPSSKFYQEKLTHTQQAECQSELKAS